MLVNCTSLPSLLVGQTSYDLHEYTSSVHNYPRLDYLYIDYIRSSCQLAKRTMDSPTSPDIDTKFSRTQLKDVAAWIRDDLDKLVARRGPDSLRPDDVLALHDIFVDLRESTTITASDLRASGIHKAVKMISDGAFRWPTRLCIECDKIISAWTTKFGEFSELHPFLHGRGGRLEGISNTTEFSRQVEGTQCL
jgi:hypothetical protein